MAERRPSPALNCQALPTLFFQPQTHKSSPPLLSKPLPSSLQPWNSNEHPQTQRLWALGQTRPMKANKINWWWKCRIWISSISCPGRPWAQWIIYEKGQRDLFIFLWNRNLLFLFIYFTGLLIICNHLIICTIEASAAILEASSSCSLSPGLLYQPSPWSPIPVPPRCDQSSTQQLG